MKKIVIILGALSILFLSGCGYKEGVATATQKSYIYFSGNANSAEASIDGGAHFDITSGQDNQYALKPGKHLIEVYRDGVMVVKREVFLGDGIAKEIEVK